MSCAAELEFSRFVGVVRQEGVDEVVEQVFVEFVRVGDGGVGQVAGVGGWCG